jgi:hypothetical protein
MGEVHTHIDTLLTTFYRGHGEPCTNSVHGVFNVLQSLHLTHFVNWDLTRPPHGSTEQKRNA